MKAEDVERKRRRKERDREGRWRTCRGQKAEDVESLAGQRVLLGDLPQAEVQTIGDVVAAAVQVAR